jgi:polyisoprenoid-binding protein YceI
MKTLKILSVLLLVTSLSVSAQKRDINPDKSVVNWTGNKIVGSHNGEIKIKSGYLELLNGNITGGTVVMDMTSITNHDLKDEEYNQRLVGHLKSDDFFGVEKYPTSTFRITRASRFIDGKARVTGVITIKGKSENISFDVTQKGDNYLAQLTVDRSKFDVRFGSRSFFNNLGDQAINDNFILDIELSF